MIKSKSNTNLKNWLPFLILALLLGAVLRLSFPGDIEYKGDERWMFETTRTMGAAHAWPLYGMTSGVASVKNPGMSVWVFIALSQITHASTPPDLARAVQLLNILGLVILAFFSYRLIPEAERSYWCWATTFVAVNPFEVIFQRKIWAQCTLPFFCVLTWIAWHYRHKRTGAFFWGLLAVCLGQIHMSGFFLAAGVLLWTILKDRGVKWGSWFLGSVIGVLPMVPWLRSLLSSPLPSGFTWSRLSWVLYPKFWFYWATDSIGIAVTNSLKTKSFFDFLRYPLIGETGTYLVGFLHIVIVVVGILVLISSVKNKSFWPRVSDKTETGLAINSVLIGSGLLMTLACLEILRHYLLMAFPLQWVWFSRLGLSDPRKGQGYLTVIWVAQLIVTALLLLYLHLNHGDSPGNYGIAYQFQKGG